MLCVECVESNFPLCKCCSCMRSHVCSLTLTGLRSPVKSSLQFDTHNIALPLMPTLNCFTAKCAFLGSTLVGANGVFDADDVAMPTIVNGVAFGGLMHLVLPFNLLSHTKLLFFDFQEDLLILPRYHCDECLTASSEA